MRVRDLIAALEKLAEEHGEDLYSPVPFRVQEPVDIGELVAEVTKPYAENAGTGEAGRWRTTSVDGQRTADGGCHDHP